ncbi:MAG TPA: hypothetical protein VIY48_22290 [Candidatus Paceibacterota bacterium]
MLKALLFGLTILSLVTGEAHSLTITNDPGGRIGAYADRYALIRNSNERVVIDGVCASACTLVLGLVPHERICATARAKLGFHQAFDMARASSNTKSVVLVPSTEATQLLMRIYPEPIRRWIETRHGLPPPNRILWLEGKALAHLVPKCGTGIGTLPPQNFNWRGLY